MTKRLAVAVVVLLCVAQATARGQSESELSRARGHFEVGMGLYRLGDFEGALKEFAAGYRLAPRPRFLLDLGHCYRKLHQLGKAREMYVRYLEQAPADDPERKNAKQALAEMEAHTPPSQPQVETGLVSPIPPAAPPPPPATAQVSPIPPAAPPPPPATVPSTSAAEAPKALVVKAQPKSGLRRYWWTIPVTAVVLGGVAVGIYFGVRPSSDVACKSTDIGCVDLSHP